MHSIWPNRRSDEAWAATAPVRLRRNVWVGAAGTDFLVVLHAANQATPVTVPADLIERSGQIGAKVTVGSIVYEVTFGRAGPVGGRMRISQSAKVVLDRDLAAGVEDDYRKWSHHPNYKTWMTRRQYKNFIGVSEVEAYRPR